MKHLYGITVKDMASLSSVSIRALHYYDEIGLLKPDRTSSNYRVYTQEHILKLQQILIQKSLGLPLATIKLALDDDSFDNLKELHSQKQILIEKINNIQAMIAAIDVAITKSNSLEKENIMNMNDIFNGFNTTEYETEAKEKWGSTDIYQMSQRKIENYTEKDWERIKFDEIEIWRDAAKAMSNNFLPSSNKARTIVDKHRHHIDKSYYMTSEESYSALADVWDNDDRFRTNIDKFGAGLTNWFVQAVKIRYKKNQ